MCLGAVIRRFRDFSAARRIPVTPAPLDDRSEHRLRELAPQTVLYDRICRTISEPRGGPTGQATAVLILTRDAAVGHLATVTVAPITSTIPGVPSEVMLDVDDGMKGRCAVNLHNAITVSQERLANRVASLNDQRMREVCAALRFSLGCG